jgi:hypothetical protein
MVDKKLVVLCKWFNSRQLLKQLVFLLFLMSFGDGEVREGLLVKSRKGIAMEDIKGNTSLKLIIKLFCRSCGPKEFDVYVLCKI